MPRIRFSLLLLIATTGVTWIAGILAPEVWALVSIGTCWIVLGTYAWIRLVNAGHWKLASIPVFFVIAICIGISLPIATFNFLMNPINDCLKFLGISIGAGKFGHVFCFAMLTLFGLKVRRTFSIQPFELGLFLVLLAVATEGFQLFVSGRTSNIMDMGFDAAGALVGLGMFAVYKLLPYDLGNSAAKKTSQPH